MSVVHPAGLHPEPSPTRVPIIGFCAAPFTLASYMIEGGGSRNFIRTKRMMYGDETLWRRLMGKIVDVLAPFATMQVASGARAIQVFDSWVGSALRRRLRSLPLSPTREPSSNASNPPAPL